MSTKVWDEITYPFPKFKVPGAVEVREWIYNFISRFIMEVITYPCIHEESQIVFVVKPGQRSYRSIWPPQVPLTDMDKL